MFSKLRKMYYEYKDARELKKYMPKEEQISKNDGADSKKVILMTAGFAAAFIVLITAALLIKGIADKKDDIKETTSYVKETPVKAGPTTVEWTSEELTVKETETGEKLTETEESSAINEFPTFPSETTITENVTKKSVNSYSGTNETQKTTIKQIKKLGVYREKNVISKSKVSVIRNSITSGFRKNVSREKQSLAAYMSKNGLKNAESTYRKLTNADKSFKCKTYSLRIDNDSEEEIIYAAEKAAEKIGSISSDYGIGICTTRKDVGYGIFIVVVY